MEVGLRKAEVIHMIVAVLAGLVSAETSSVVAVVVNTLQSDIDFEVVLAVTYEN